MVNDTWTNPEILYLIKVTQLYEPKFGFPSIDPFTLSISLRSATNYHSLHQLIVFFTNFIGKIFDMLFCFQITHDARLQYLLLCVTCLFYIHTTGNYHAFLKLNVGSNISGCLAFNIRPEYHVKPISLIPTNIYERLANIDCARVSLRTFIYVLWHLISVRLIIVTILSVTNISKKSISMGLLWLRPHGIHTQAIRIEGTRKRTVWRWMRLYNASTMNPRFILRKMLTIFHPSRTGFLSKDWTSQLH